MLLRRGPDRHDQFRQQPTARAQVAVYDPSNYAQNVLQAARALQSGQQPDHQSLQNQRP
jgi:conjugal transfer/entry exclusion protein